MKFEKRVFLAEVLQNAGNCWNNTGIQKDFLWNWSITKIKHETIYNTFKMVDQELETLKQKKLTMCLDRNTS